MSKSGLGNLTLNEIIFIGIVLEGLWYGFYSAIFFMYIKYQASKPLGIDKRNVLPYALCVLYILSVVTVVLDTMGSMLVVNLGPSSPRSLLLHLFYVSGTINGLCDFISQAILIYRCWVIWNHNIRVIIIPSILALTFLADFQLCSPATWLASATGSIYIAPDSDFFQTYWGRTLTPASLAISLTVNAVVTGLIVLRILKVSREFGLTFGHRTLGVGNSAEAKVRSIIFIMIESGMLMFAIQLIRVVLTILNVDATKIIIGAYQMFNGITPTTILLRVSMGLSFHDQKSVSEIVESLHFDENTISETGVVESVGLDCIGIQQHDDISIVDK